MTELTRPGLDNLKRQRAARWPQPVTLDAEEHVETHATFVKFASVIDANAKKIAANDEKIAALEKELAELRQKLKDQEPKPE
jgi:uncharacterized protein YceH (UPF0502 family)